MSTRGRGGSAGRTAARGNKARMPSKQPPAAADLSTTLRTLACRSNAGDSQALAELRRFLDDRPEIWETCGDLGRRAERCWIDLVADGDALSAESIKKFVQQLK